MEDLQGLLLLVAAQEQETREAGPLGQLLPEGLHHAVGMVPLLLVRLHETAQEVRLDAGLGEDHLCRPVDLGGRGVAARIGIVGDLEPLPVEGVDAEDGAAAAQAVVADIARVPLISVTIWAI